MSGCNGYCGGSLTVSVTTAGTYYLHLVVSTDGSQAACPYCGIQGSPLLVIVR